MKNRDSELAAKLDFAVAAAREAGWLTLSYFQREDLQVDRKEDASPVTAADHAAEQLLRERIGERFPQDGIVGEEFGESAGESGQRWILDPIDGTKSFICGVPLYGTLVGLEREGRGVIGVIYVPALDECVYAARGLGAWYTKGEASPRPAKVSQRSLFEGTFLTSQVDSFEERGAGEAFRRLQSQASITRTWGDCYGYLLVATGRAEAMVDPVMNLWDAAALQPILEEAGGAYTDWQGEPTIHNDEGLGAGPRAQREVLEVLRAYPRRK
ncbi:MAG: histidinol-phosphatase [Planctomycetes bacterium]|nr:histidinol-phosphatase [Planctomycetota bacterium]